MVLSSTGNGVFAHTCQASLPARHAVPFTFPVNVSHCMNPLNGIACMRFIASAP